MTLKILKLKIVHKWYTTLEYIQYLEIFIDQHLRWLKHAEYINKRLRKLIYNFFVLRNILNTVEVIVESRYGEQHIKTYKNYKQHRTMFWEFETFTRNTFYWLKTEMKRKIKMYVVQNYDSLSSVFLSLRWINMKLY